MYIQSNLVSKVSRLSVHAGTLRLVLVVVCIVIVVYLNITITD
jgi:hypothetical protein